MRNAFPIRSSRLAFCAALFAVAAHAPAIRALPPPPTEAAQADAVQLVKEIYGKDLAAAKTIDQKKTLAKQLLAKGQGTGDDPIARYVLLKASRSVAIQALDAEMAFETIDLSEESFAIDVLQMKTDVLNALQQKVSAPAEQGVVAGLALGLMEQASADDKFEAATQLGEIALDMARKTHNPQVLRQVQTRLIEAKLAGLAFTEQRAALATMEKTPDDAAANQVVGKYLCFVKGEWDRGIPKLALAKDEELYALAQKDLAEPTSSDQRADLGDGWWDLAEKQDGATRSQIQRRAGYWYRKALPGLSGLARARIEKRLDGLPADIQAETARDVEADPPAERPGGAAPAQPAAGVVIVSARWGGGSHWANVTARVKDLVAQGKNVWASTDCLHSDPTPHWKKRLEITYTKGGRKKAVHVDEGQKLKSSDFRH